ncbi:Gfo/Idh/MocA family oxidoreductase [soil metagenome]
MSALTGTPIRVGIVGVGNWARHGHLRVLSMLPQYQVTAVFSQRRDAAEAAAREYGIAHVVDSLDALVGHPDVDLVVVLNTAPQHAASVRAAIAAGKDVYCEWPLTPSTATSMELVQLARQAGVRTLLGAQRRLAPHNRYLADLLREGYVGALRSARLHVSMNYFQPQLPKSLAWTVPPENFSSMVAIYAGHFLDMLFTAIGWPDRIQVTAVNQFPVITIIETGEQIQTTNADEFVLTGTYPDGAIVTAHFEGGKRNGSGVQLDITGTRGDLRISNSSSFGDVGDDYRVFGAQGDQLELRAMPVPSRYDSLPPGSGLPSAVLELAHNYVAFANDQRDGTKTAPTFEDGVRLHRLFDAAAVAASTGQRVTFDSGLRSPDRSNARTDSPAVDASLS